MPLYEHVFLARQDVSQAQVDQMVEQFSNVIKEGGGSVGKTEYWGLKTLAYKIKKATHGHYLFFNHMSPAGVPAEIERIRAAKEAGVAAAEQAARVAGHVELHHHTHAPLARVLNEPRHLLLIMTPVLDAERPKVTLSFWDTAGARRAGSKILGNVNLSRRGGGADLPLP